MIVFTKQTADEILTAFDNKEMEFEVSLDLGRSLSKIAIKDGGLFFQEKLILDIDSLKKQRIDSYTCYFIENGEIKKVQIFSEETNRFYKLVPTNSIPTLQISGIFMHRHLAMDPMFDTILKIKEISPVKGKVLDTCTGLGYTAIFAAQKADEVLTFEKDPNVLNICRYNPFSEELFWNKKIRVNEGSIIDGIKKLESGYFDRIVHDPPSIKIAGDLYSNDFYKELYRVLKPKGILYHYTGLPESKSHKRNLPEEVSERLMKVGFKKVKFREMSLGVTAAK